jgi:hypothetical protein
LAVTIGPIDYSTNGTSSFDGIIVGVSWLSEEQYNCSQSYSFGKMIYNQRVEPQIDNAKWEIKYELLEYKKHNGNCFVKRGRKIDPCTTGFAIKSRECPTMKQAKPGN